MSAARVEELTQIKITPLYQQLVETWPAFVGKYCPVTCTRCSGIGTVKVNYCYKGKTTKFDSQCPTCEGSKKMVFQDFVTELYRQNMWCECKGEDESFLAEDGRKFYGNDTWICRKCELVTQFG